MASGIADKSPRLRIGNSHIMHSYLLKGEEEPQCIPCNVPLTINHILVDCEDLAPTRKKVFSCRQSDDLVQYCKVRVSI